MSVPWDTLIPRCIKGAEKVVVVGMESKYWLVKMLAECGKKQVLGKESP